MCAAFLHALTFAGRRSLEVPSRTLFLHIGTHKTGTTSLQELMALNARRFEKAGVLYPKAGRLATESSREMAGHHNIAWELTGDARFDPRAGTFAEMLDEIAASRPGTAVVSSEDFESLFRHPETLTRMGRAFAEIGYSPKAIVYLRSQADYAQSLYAELVRYHGFDRSFDWFLAEVSAARSFAFHAQTFAFDYEALTSAFEAAFGEKSLTVRSYVTGRATKALLSEFVEIFIPRGAKLWRLRQPARLNETASFIGILESLHTTIGQVRPAGPELRSLAREVDPIGADPAFLSERFNLFTDEEAVAFQAQFGESNAHVLERYDSRVPDPSPAPSDHERQSARRKIFQSAMRQLGLNGKNL
jgi:hypothetical protein